MRVCLYIRANGRAGMNPAPTNPPDGEGDPLVGAGFIPALPPAKHIKNMRHGENGMITVAGVRAGMNPAPTVDGSDFITAHPTNPVALIKARKTFVPASLELYVTGGSVVRHR